VDDPNAFGALAVVPALALTDTTDARSRPAVRPGTSHSSRHLGARVTLVALVAVLSGIGVGVLASREPDGPSVTTQRTGDARARTVVEQEGITITLDRPTTVASATTCASPPGSTPP